MERRHRAAFPPSRKLGKCISEAGSNTQRLDLKISRSSLDHEALSPMDDPPDPYEYPLSSSLEVACRILSEVETRPKLCLVHSAQYFTWPVHRSVGVRYSPGNGQVTCLFQMTVERFPDVDPLPGTMEVSSIVSE